MIGRNRNLLLPPEPPEPVRESFFFRFSPADLETSLSVTGVFRPTSIGSNVEGFDGATLTRFTVGGREQLVGTIPLGALHAHGVGFPHALRDLWKLSGVESGLSLLLPTIARLQPLVLACTDLTREVEIYLDGWYLPQEGRP